MLDGWRAGVRLELPQTLEVTMKVKMPLLLLLLVVTATAQVRPGFDPKDVVWRVREARTGRFDRSEVEWKAVGGERLADDGEFLIDTSISYVPARYEQDSPATASDGTNYLVVWADRRSVTADYHIYGARVAPQGVVLDPIGIPISITANHHFSPAVAFGGTNFLVVWEDYRSGDTSDIYGARVTPSGVVLDPDGIPIAIAANRQQLPAVAFDGTNYLVVWTDDRRGIYSQDIYGARVTPSGVVLDPQGIPISTAGSFQNEAAVAFDGTNYLVVWVDGRNGEYDIYGARVTPGGVVLDPNGIIVSTAPEDQYEPAVAFAGTNYLAVWHDDRTGSYCDIYGARVTPQGTVLDPDGIHISTGADWMAYPAVGFDGTNCLVVWQDRRSGFGDIYGARVTPNGVVLDTSGIQITTAADWQGYPAVAFDGTNYVVVCTDRRSGCCDIYGSRVTPAGIVLDPDGILISTAVSWQGYPAAAFDGTNYFVVWEDFRSANWDIYGARVTPGGVVLDPSGIPISTAADDQRSPAVSFDGTNYLVVWQDNRSDPESDIYGARVTPAGVVLDTGIAIFAGWDPQELPAVAFDGQNYLVVWVDWRSGTYLELYGTRVTPAGVVLDSNGIPFKTGTYVHSIDVVFDGRNYFVVWDDWLGPSSDIYGMRVTPEGVALDSGGIPISTRRSEDEYAPAVAFDGTNYLVVWETYQNRNDDIYGARVTPDGIVLDSSGIPISIAASDQGSPAVAFDGTNYLVVWEDYRSGGYSDIYGARVRPDGTVFDEGPIVRQEGDQVCPALARGTGNRMFLVYQGWTGTVGGKTYNAYRIWGKMNPSPGIEEGSMPEASRPMPEATIVRGILRLPASSVERGAPNVLLDITGRKVMELKPGPNNIRHLAPGVYFVRRASGVDSCFRRNDNASSVTKVVIAR
ncbi:MAG: hypothetical protein ABIK44_04315 [candidate division WOR-3 bacterium]